MGDCRYGTSRMGKRPQNRSPMLLGTGGVRAASALDGLPLGPASAKQSESSERERGHRSRLRHRRGVSHDDREAARVVAESIVGKDEDERLSLREGVAGGRGAVDSATGASHQRA